MFLSLTQTMHCGFGLVGVFSKVWSFVYKCSFMLKMGTTLLYWLDHTQAPQVFGIVSVLLQPALGINKDTVEIVLVRESYLTQMNMFGIITSVNSFLKIIIVLMIIYKSYNV